MVTEAGKRHIAEFGAGQFGRVERAVEAIEQELYDMVVKDMTDRGLAAPAAAIHERFCDYGFDTCREDAAAFLGEKGVYTTDGTVFAEGIEKIVESERDLRASFDLRWKADMRAIKRWQAAHPERPNVELTWPDHADLVVWLLGEVERLEQGLKIMQENFPKTIPAPMDRP